MFCFKLFLWFGDVLPHGAREIGRYSCQNTRCRGEDAVPDAPGDFVCACTPHADAFVNLATLQVLTELAAWAESQAGGAASGRQLRQGFAAEVLDPPADVRAFLGAVAELHFLDVGLNCRGAYITGEHRCCIAARMRASLRPRSRLLCRAGPKAEAVAALFRAKLAPDSSRLFFNCSLSDPTCSSSDPTCSSSISSAVFPAADPQVALELGAAAAAGRRPPPRVLLHGTPRQWDDPTRPWIGAPDLNPKT